jgi:hypothetical protein
MSAQSIDLIQISHIVRTHTFRLHCQRVVEKLNSLCFQGVLVNFQCLL